MAGQGPLGGGGDWLRGGLSTVLATLNNQGVAPGQQIFNNYGGAAGNAAKSGLTTTANNEQQFMNGLRSNLGTYQASIPGQMNQNPAMAQGNLLNNAAGLHDPMVNSSSNYVGGLGEQGSMLPTAMQNFQSGGWTPQYQQEYDALQGITGAGSSANNLVGNFGQTDFNINAQAMANNMLGQGGWTPQLSMGLDPTANILGAQGNNAQSGALMAGGSQYLQNGGANPGSAALFSGGNPFLQSGGQTALTNNMAGRGVDLYSQQALMSPAQAAGLARNQAATQYGQQEQQAETQAMNRGGGAGATVANGLQNQGMADFYNQASQGTSNAVSNALNTQQGLNLTQQGQGINLAQGSGQLQNALFGTGSQAVQGAGGLANQFLNSGAGMVQGSGGLANNLFESGLGNVSQMNNSAANTMSPYVQYGSAGMGNQQGMLNAGSNLLLGGLGAQNQTMGQQNQYQLGMGNFQNTMTQGAGSNLNNFMGTSGQLNNLAGQLGLGQFGAMTGAENASLNTGVNMGNTYSSLLNNYFNPLTNLAQQGSGIWNTGLGSQASLMGGGAAAAAGGQNPMAQGEIGAILGLLGGI